MYYKFCFRHSVALITIAFTNTCAFSQQDWRIQSDINLAKSNYSNSQVLDQQKSKGIRLDFDRGDIGSTLGFQNTRIDLLPVLNQPQQNQDNWLGSIYKRFPVASLSGQVTLKLDAHHLRSSDPTQANIHVIAPQASWTSAQLPLGLDLSLAHSSYPTMPTVKQYGLAARWGFNQRQDWLEIRQYRIQKLDPIYALGNQDTQAHEIRLTHLFTPNTSWQPKRISVALERGEKIFFVDMQSQTVYNMSMLNKGGHSVASTWSIRPKVDFTLQFNQNKYSQRNDFTLTTVSAQTSIGW